MGGVFAAAESGEITCTHSQRQTTASCRHCSPSCANASSAICVYMAGSTIPPGHPHPVADEAPVLGACYRGSIARRQPSAVAQVRPLQRLGAYRLVRAAEAERWPHETCSTKS
jgi:hypothetical protein